jgi:hypothetical protein
MPAPIRFNDGSSREGGKTRYASGADIQPKHDVIEGHHGEGIGAITQRAYGANTKELQDRIRNANASLIGKINVPR